MVKKIKTHTWFYRLYLRDPGIPHGIPQSDIIANCDINAAQIFQRKLRIPPSFYYLNCRYLMTWKCIYLPIKEANQHNEVT